MIAPRQNVVITSSLSEPATGVFANEGDLVRRGEILAQLDTADLRANLDAAQRSAAEADVKVAQTTYQGQLAISQGADSLYAGQDALAQALAKVVLDRRNLARDRQLAAGGYIPQQTYEAALQLYVNDLAAARSAHSALRNARTTVAVNGTQDRGLQATTVQAAQAAAASARSGVEQAQAQLAKATIVSPIDGIVVNRNFNEGEYPGTRALFTLQDTATVYAVLSATSSQVFGLHDGDPVDIAAGRTTKQSARGTVIAVLGQTVPGSTNFTVKARVPNPERVFASGMVVSGVIHLPSVSGVVVPTSAFTDETRSHVIVVRNGIANTVPVREVVSTRGESVVSGLSAGQRVVDDGAVGLGNGAPMVN